MRWWDEVEGGGVGREVESEMVVVGGCQVEVDDACEGVSEDSAFPQAWRASGGLACALRVCGLRAERSGRRGAERSGLGWGAACASSRERARALWASPASE
jgi:hypothetical protein